MVAESVSELQGYGGFLFNRNPNESVSETDFYLTPTPKMKLDHFLHGIFKLQILTSEC